MFVIDGKSSSKKQTSWVTPDADKAEELFRIKYKYAVTHAHGMERLAFLVLPYSLLRSFALTFDPLEKFKLSGYRITTMNRTRTRKKPALTTARSLVGNDWWLSTTTNPNTSSCTWTPAVVTNTNTPVNTALSSVPNHIEVCKDTTRRTRPVESDMGEFESFTYSFQIPERVIHRVDSFRSQGSTSACHLIGHQEQDGVQNRRTVGGAAYMSTADIASLRTSTVQRTNTAIANRLSKSLVSSLASSQRYTILRNVIELKDLPRSVLSLGRTLKDFESAFRSMPEGLASALQKAKTSDHVPNEWLSFWFGWRATYKAVTDLVEAPQKIAKDINFLISRKGVPTTVRRSVKFAGDTSTTPAFTFNPGNIFGSGWSDLIESTSTRNVWEHEIKLVVNMIFDFPEVGVPKLRRDLFLRKMGFSLTPTDIYNLIPWTWLVDWYTGLGNYVELIDAMNTDKALINWGIVTGITTGSVTTEATCKYDNLFRTSYRHNFDTPITTSQTIPVRRVIPAVMKYKCVVRKDIPSGLGVKTLLKPENLSPYQQSIIGAILAQRANKAL